MRSEELLNQKFRATKYTHGYDQQEVDDFIDRAAATLRRYESGVGGPDPHTGEVGGPQTPVTATSVTDVTFTQTVLTRGYNQNDVDELLDRLADVFAAHEQRLTRTST